MVDNFAVVLVTDGVHQLSDLMDGLVVMVMRELLLMDGSEVFTFVMASDVLLVVMAALEVSLMIVVFVVNGALVVRGLLVATVVITVVFSLAVVVLGRGDSHDGSECERFHF